MNTAVRFSLAPSVRSLSPGSLTSRLNTKARATARTRIPQTISRTISMGPPLPSRELGHVAGGKDAAVTLAVWLVRMFWMKETNEGDRLAAPTRVSVFRTTFARVTVS